MLTLNTKKFEIALKKAMRFIDKKTKLPVLANVMMIVKDGVAKLYATNLYNGCEIKVEGITGDDCAFVFSNTQNLFKSLAFFDKEMTIDITEDGNKINVKSGKKGLNQLLIPSSEFPYMPEITSGSTIEMDAVDVYKCFKKVEHALAEEEETRPVMQCVKISNGNMIATDGFVISLTGLNRTYPDMLIPGDTLPLLDLFDGEITLEIDSNVKEDEKVCNCVYSDANTRIFSRIPDWQFPDVNVIFPRMKDVKEKRIINRKSMLDSLQYLTKMMHGKYAMLVKHVGGVMISTTDDGDEVQGEYEGEKIESDFAFSSVLMSDILKQYSDAEEVRIMFWADNRPLVVEPVMANCDSFCIIMPMYMEKE